MKLEENNSDKSLRLSLFLLNNVLALGGIGMITTGAMGLNIAQKTVATVPQEELIATVIVGSAVILTSVLGSVGLFTSRPGLLLVYLSLLMGVVVAQLAMGIVIAQQTGDNRSEVQTFWTGMNSYLGIPMHAILFIVMALEMIILVLVVFYFRTFRKPIVVSEMMEDSERPPMTPLHVPDESAFDSEEVAPVTPSTPYGEIPKSLLREESGSEAPEEEETAKRDRKWSTISLGGDKKESGSNQTEQPEIIQRVEEVMEDLDEVKQREAAKKLAEREIDQAFSYADAVKQDE